jgi:hypothetical protein
MKTYLRILPVLAFCLALSSCSMLATLETIANITAAAVPILQDAGVPIPGPVIVYVQNVANCIAAQTAEPTPIMLAQIGTCLSAQLLPALDPNLPPAVQSIIMTVAKDVEAFLTQHPAGQAMKLKAGVDPHTLKFSAGDSAKFKAIQAKAADTVHKVAILAAKQEGGKLESPHNVKGRK